MKRSLIVFAVSVVASILSYSLYSQESASKQPVAKSMVEVKLTASIEGMEYCKGDNDIYSVHLRLRLRLNNLGSANLIVYKPKKPIEIAGGMIAKSPQALEDQHYESTLQYDQFIEPTNIPESQRPDPKVFAIIGQGKSFDLAGNVAIPVRFRSASPLPGTIESGDHVMIVNVADWPFSVDAWSKLQKRWANVGILNQAMMKSEPFEFSIPSAPSLRECFKNTGAD